MLNSNLTETETLSIYLKVFHIVNLQAKFDTNVHNLINFSEKQLTINLLGDNNANEKEIY